MKKILFALFALGILFNSGCDTLTKKKGELNGSSINNPNGPNGEEGGAPVMVFEEDKHEFGTIQVGEVVTYSYKFTNEGTADLVISDAHASCGCTVPNWPKQPVRPGESGVIDVKFDSNGKQGDVTKEVSISTNCNPSVKVIYFHVFVKTANN